MRRPSFISAAGSILFRLPPAFLIPFTVLSLGWTFWLFKKSSQALKPHPESEFVRYLNSVPLLSALDELFLAVVFVALYLAILVAIYNASVLINWLWIRYWPKVLHRCLPASVARRLARQTPDNVLPYRPAATNSASDLFKDVKHIGIVLAGGGAKGAFQAGAMKSIYRFLAENNALDKVKVISGTSIGAWNGLFWLSDLIKSPDGWRARSVHENWWRSISLKSLVAPGWYVPTFRNAFLDTTPWQDDFDRLFGQDRIKQHLANTPIRFYFTRANVRTGGLECTTNHENAVEIPKVKHRTHDGRRYLDPARGVDAFLEGIKFGVFASMDLPPLFPYMHSDDDFYEDGGVIDNLPIMFAAMNNCDLIFVLPLNSDFHAIPEHRSLLHRFLRVMDVRQGALEQGGLKTLYLYNEIAALRDHINAIKAQVAVPPIAMSDTLKLALSRTHCQTRIFAVCPLRSFVESTINTHQLWKGREAGLAFSTMYDATGTVLAEKFDLSRERTTVYLINEGGAALPHENF